MTNSKMKPDSLKLLSLNVRDLGNFRKRRAIFTWCLKQRADLTNFSSGNTYNKELRESLEKEWGSCIVFSHGGTNARVVAVLIRSGLLLFSTNTVIQKAG